MLSDSSMAAVYTDFQGLMRLKAEAGKQTPQAIQETARQFEALFVQTMLKAMRDASPGDGMGDSNQTEFYRDMYDQQMALHMVKGRGLGIADMLVSRLGGSGPETLPEEPAAVSRETKNARPVVDTASGQPFMPGTSARAIVSLDNTHPVEPLVSLHGQVNAAVYRDGDKTSWRPETPEEFIRDLLPHASKGAAELGVAPGVLIAQAALETGWGQKIIQHADGRSSFNLFGIKADAGWSGDRVKVATLEYENGIAVKRRAAFRSYDSLQGAVSGYVDFLRSNPRYQQALQQAADPHAYLQGLEAAGYATDPDYAGKIKAIMKRDSLLAASNRLLSQVSPFNE